VIDGGDWYQRRVGDFDTIIVCVLRLLLLDTEATCLLRAHSAATTDKNIVKSQITRSNPSVAKPASKTGNRRQAATSIAAETRPKPSIDMSLTASLTSACS
jgi:hypothetical protein